MPLSILNNIAALTAENNINNTQTKLSSTLNQLSSGSKINSGADDPSALAVSDGMGANEAALSQSATNASSGVGLLQTADGALSQVTSLLDQAVTLATEASNGTLTSSQVSSANQEYQNILTQIGNIGSSTNFNSSTVFTSSATNIVVTDGTSSGVNTYADIIGSMSTSSVGTTAGSAVTTSNLSTATTTAANSTAAVTKVAGVYTLATTSSADDVSGQLSITVGSNAPINVTIAASTSIGSLVTQLNQNGSDFKNAGLTAGTDGSGNLTITGPTTGATTASNTLSFTGTSIADANATPQTLTTLATTTPASGKDAVAANSVISVTSGDTVSGTITAKVGTGATATTASLTVKSGTTAATLAGDINNNSDFKAAGITAAYNSTTGAVTLTSATSTPTTNALTVDTTALNQSTVSTPGAGADFTTASTATLTASTAATILTTITQAVADVAYQRGTIGADINELTSAEGVASSENVNITSAQDSISATDYGTAASNLSKYQILSQTGISALAQANSVQQEVLKLLQ